MGLKQLYTFLADFAWAGKNKKGDTFQAAFEHAAIGMEQVSLNDGRLLEVNSRLCQMLGYTREEMLKRTFMQNTDPVDLQRENIQLQRLIAGDIPSYTLEKRYIRKDGTPVWVRVTSSLAGSDADYRVSVIEDISDRKAAEERLRTAGIEVEQLLESERAARKEAESANRIKDDFLATISHELRTPLNAILGWAQLLNRRRVEPEKALPIIERSARAQAELIEELLDMNRIISGRLQMNFKILDVTEIMRGPTEKIRPLADEKAINLSMSIPEDLCCIEADPGRIQQVVFNLLNNAVKFTDPGGRIYVNVEKHGDSADIIIRDTGKGIEPDFLPQLFSTFRQEDSSITRRHGGLGVGLAIAKRITDLHHGSLHAVSSGKGHGSTFTLSLPLVSPAITEERMPERESGDIHDMSILVVEDDPAARMLVEHILLDKGASVLSADSGKEALSLLENQDVDMVVSDIGMPDMDGYKLMRAIRSAKEPVKSIPSIALTAFAREEDRERALEAGFSTHLTKPVDPNCLLRTVCALSHREMKRGAEELPPPSID